MNAPCADGLTASYPHVRALTMPVTARHEGDQYNEDSCRGGAMSEPKVKRRFVPSLPGIRRWGKRICLSLLGLMVSVAIYCAVKHRQACAAVEKAVAELDESEAGWRLEDIEAAREKVPDEQNSAPTIVRVAALLPTQEPDGWPPRDLRASLESGSPAELLPAETAARLEQELRPLDRALREAAALR